ncbi:MAG: DUF2167 domain-containing protein [Bryobacteraceae bacterium]
MRIVRLALLALAVALLGKLALAAPKAAAPLPQKEPVPIAGGKAQVLVKPGFVFLESEKAQKMLETWGNPPDGSVLGMLVPTSGDNNWGITISYEAEGFVDADDAGEIDYEALLAQLKQETHDASVAAKAKGFPGSELMGWATAPRYAADSHTMYWSKEIKFDNSPEAVINYDMRILGRYGMLVLQGVFFKSQLKQVEPKILAALPGVEFTEGNRYEDHSAGDRVSKLGLGAVILGKPAAKALILVLIKSAKWIVIGLVALFGAIKKFLKKKSPKPGDMAAPAPAIVADTQYGDSTAPPPLKTVGGQLGPQLGRMQSSISREGPPRPVAPPAPTAPPPLPGGHQAGASQGAGSRARKW